MKSKRILPALLLALLISGACTFWLSRKFSMPHAAAHRRYVAAGQAMQAGEMLHANNVQTVDWPDELPLTGAFAQPAQVEGRILLYPIAAGQPVLDQQLAAAGSGPGLSPKIPDGMRAISLKSDEVVGVAGFLLPGTHVDVLVTYHIAPSPDPLTSTVLQDAQVLTAGQKMQPDPDGKPTTVDVVTLLVSPADAEKVVLASAQGSVHFVLRNGSDHNHLDEQTADLADFGGEPRPTRVVEHVAVHRAPVTIAAAPRPYMVQTIRGDKQTMESFQ